jgi:hypothetical protein
MPAIVTTMHDATALFETCRRLGLDAPKQDSAWLGDYEVFGWLVDLPGLYAPLICDTLTGLVAYHRQDNEFRRYAQVMHFVHRYYAVRAPMPAVKPAIHSVSLRRHRRLVLTCDAA